MSYNFTPLKQKFKDVEEWLKREFAQIRTGRATPAILDGMKIESYGNLTPINQVASISVEDPRSLRIAPWDVTNIKLIEKAVISSNLGLSVTIDDKGLRVLFPELTSERRASFIKIAKQKLEDAKVTLRNERERVLKDIDSKEKEQAISEDDKFRLKIEFRKLLDEVNINLEEIFGKKEKEISD